MAVTLGCIKIIFRPCRRGQFGNDLQLAEACRIAGGNRHPLQLQFAVVQEIDGMKDEIDLVLMLVALKMAVIHKQIKVHSRCQQYKQQ